MLKIYRVATTLVLFTLATAAISILINYESGWQISLVLLLPILWTLWIACVVKNEQAWKLALLWVLIDITNLFVSRLIMGSFDAVDPRGGSELVWLMEFSPPILPTILFGMLPVIGTWLSAISHGASNILLPAGSIGVLKDWLDGSIMTAISSFLFANLWFHWMSMRKNKLAKQTNPYKSESDSDNEN